MAAQIALAGIFVVRFAETSNIVGASFSVLLMVFVVSVTVLDERFGKDFASVSLLVALIFSVLWSLPSREMQFGNWIGELMRRDLTVPENYLLLAIVCAPLIWALHVVGKSLRRKV